MLRKTTLHQKYAIPFCIILITNLAFAGCTSQPSVTQPITTKGNIRLSIADAELLVRDFIFQRNPDMNPKATFPLEEITTDDIWQKLHVQIFRLTSDNPIGKETYAITNGEIDVLGYSFGGFGVTSMLVTDLDSDKNPELTYTHSSGSGMHRSFVSVYFPNRIYSRNITANLQFFYGDLILERVDDQSIIVKSSSYDWEKGAFVTDMTIGQVLLESSNSQPLLLVELNPNLPSDVLERLVTH